VLDCLIVRSRSLGWDAVGHFILMEIIEYNGGSSPCWFVSITTHNLDKNSLYN
jgi:hypothetical protein